MKNNGEALISSGFTYWKNALKKFSTPEQSPCHRHVVQQFQQMKSGPVTVQLSKQKAAEQASARAALLTIFSSIRYLARQGLALREHSEEQGNLMQPLTLRSEDNSNLTAWLSRNTNFLYPDSQNEIIELLSRSVQREIVHAVTTSSKQFAVIIDGKQDCSGTEKESICLRYVDNHLLVHEVFVGLYSPPNTTGQTLAAVVTDVLTRQALPIENVRAQTYDGAANMASQFNGCQAIISRQYPLAIFFHSAAHCANLVAEGTVDASLFIRDALSIVNEFGVGESWLP